MNLIAQLKRFMQPAPAAMCSAEERDFVRRMSGGACRVRYCGRTDLVGLKIIGTHCGIRVEQAPQGRFVRVIKMIRGREVITAEAHPLRLDRNKKVILAGIRDLVH